MVKDLIQKLEIKLNGPRFRMLTSYMTKNENGKRITNPVIRQYHEGYKQQIEKWEVNPLDVVIELLNKNHKDSKIADIGCGEALISKKFKNVESFDLYPINERITKADIDEIPLENDSVDIAVYCLSLLKTNIFNAIKEANRILKLNGHLVIAETKSRIFSDSISRKIRRMGFKIDEVKEIAGFFYLFVFKKISKTEEEEGVIEIKPFEYKKR